jgi:hypothetical protein
VFWGRKEGRKDIKEGRREGKGRERRKCSGEGRKDVKEGGRRGG